MIKKGNKSKISENGLINVLIVDDYIKYIGESKRYGIPLNYHKNNVKKESKQKLWKIIKR